MDYKGIYYGDSKSQRFFEFGAHFKYSELYRQLELLGGKTIDNNDKFHLRNKSIDIPKQILLSEEKKIMTRNKKINNNLFLNNPSSQNYIFNKTFHLNKNRKKTYLVNSTNTLNSNYNLIEPYFKIKKSILLNIPTSNEKKKNNVLEQNDLMSKNKFKNLFIYQTKIDNEIPSLKTQVINTRKNTSNLKYNSLNSPQNNIKYNNLIHSRNKNHMISSITDDKRKGLLSSIKRKTYDNEMLFNKSKNQRKLTIISQNFSNLKLNNKNTSSRNSHKKYITNKLNSNRFSSGENILNIKFK